MEANQQPILPFTQEQLSRSSSQEFFVQERSNRTSFQVMSLQPLSFSISLTPLLFFPSLQTIRIFMVAKGFSTIGTKTGCAARTLTISILFLDIRLCFRKIQECKSMAVQAEADHIRNIHSD